MSKPGSLVTCHFPGQALLLAMMSNLVISPEREVHTEINFCTPLLHPKCHPSLTCSRQAPSNDCGLAVTLYCQS